MGNVSARGSGAPQVEGNPVPIEVEGNRIAAGAHAVQFYERDTELIGSVAGYLAAGVQAGEAAVVVASDGHRRGFEQAMEAVGIDLAGAIRRGSYLALDAAETVARFVVDGRVDRAGFQQVIGGLIRQAAGRAGPVRVFGEMVAVLWQAGYVMAAIELEELWNELQAEVEFSLLCAYRSGSIEAADHPGALAQVCGLHSSVVQGQMTRSFEPVVDAPRAARHFLVETLRCWGHHDLIDRAALAVTELATNAVLHARSAFTVVVASGTGMVKVSVRDDSPVPPRLSLGAPLAQSGRGVALVAAVANRWGTDVLAQGKVVWAEIARLPATP
jgi:hypothetical protein